MKNYHVQKGDAVVVNSGKWKGKNATIIAVITKNDRVALSFADLTAEERKSSGMRTVKKNRRSENGPGMIERTVSIHVSNVALTEEARKAKMEKKAALKAKKAERRAANGVK